MKRLRIYGLLLWLLLFLPVVFAQRAEYWVDVDPGLGRSTLATVSGSNGTVSLNTASLAPGLHIIGIRSAVGRTWGITYTHLFLVPPAHGSVSITGAEYWIDFDPGQGKATTFAVNSNATQLSVPFSTEDLTAGLHTIGVRLRQGDTWGIDYTHTFLVIPTSNAVISGAEYWIDADPGHGKGTAVAANGSTTQLSVPIATDTLSAGLHIVGVRMRQGDTWGIDYIHTFLVIPAHNTAISGAEYWIDTDPGHGKATAIAANGSTTQLSVPIAADTLSAGMHIVGVRLRQGDNWGIDYTHTFLVVPNRNTAISGAEYWIDSDPGHGNATAIAANGSATQLSLPVATDELPVGTHVIGMRLRQGDTWGQTYTHSFLVLPSTTFEMTVQAVEAYWDYDFENPINIPFSQVGDSVIISNYPLSTNALTLGKHTLYIRAKADGKWGFLYEQEVCKTPVPLFEAFGDGDFICQGGTVYIDDQSSNTDQTTAYAWDMNGDGVTDYTSAGGFTHIYTEAGTYTITLTLTTPDGCEASYAQEVVIHSSANPTVALSLSNNVCEGTEVALTATATNAGDAPAYEWLRNGQVIGTTDLPTFAYSNFADSDRVAVRLTADNPCALNPVVTSEETVMVIYALPEIELNVPAVIYTDAGVVQLGSMATPAGGQFFLDDATRQTTFIRAGSVGLGEHSLRYVVATEHGCRSEAQTTFTVMDRPTYTITFVDEDGITILQQSQVALDAMPTPPADPSKQEDEHFTYSFAGWVPDIVAATEAATYKATYTPEEKIVTAVEMTDDALVPHKVIENANLFIILPDGTRYSATGVKVE